MKSSEFLRENQTDKKNVTINIPITITIPSSGGDPVVGTDSDETTSDDSVMVPPLQQHLELQKHQSGKQSKVIKQLVSDEPETNEEQPNKEIFNLEESADYNKLMSVYKTIRNKKLVL